MTKKKAAVDSKKKPIWGDWIESGSVVFAENMKWVRSVSFRRDQYGFDEHGSPVLLSFEVKTEVQDV